jgi:NAD(P)-dependent dehydrogenase (short-subunit alcohol dehydrogenase family)
MDLGVQRRSALIVGGARGIGRATAVRLAAATSQLVIADVDAAAAVASARAIEEETGARVLGMGVDLRVAAQVDALVVKANGWMGGIDIAINCAAVVDDKLFLDSAESDWQRMVDVCLFGTMRLLRAVLPAMVERRYGRVVCLASDAARVGQARLSYYAAAKAGVIALVKSVAAEVGATGVTLNVVSPGATNTELRRERERGLREQMGAEKYARREQSVLRMYPLRRIGEPDDIASAVIFLVSENASWITGQVLSVNGGFVMP